MSSSPPVDTQKDPLKTTGCARASGPFVTTAWRRLSRTSRMTADAQKAQIHQMAEAIRRLMAEIARLAATDLPPGTFFKELLVRAVRAIDAAGGAVWIRSARRLSLIAEVEFASSRFSDDPRQAEAIRAALAWVNQHGRSVIIAPMAQDWPDDGPPQGIPNYTPMPFFLVPIVAAERVAGVVQVWLPPGRDPKHYRHFMEFTIKVTQYAESYVCRRQGEQAVRQTRRLEELLSLTAQLPLCRSSDELAGLVVNLGCELVGAARLVLLASRKPGTFSNRAHPRVVAASGLEATARPGADLRAIEDLGGAALEADAPRAFRRPAQSAHAGADDKSPPTPPLPPQAQRYFNSSPYDALVLLPLCSDRNRVGVLAAEYATPVACPKDEDLAMLESLARQLGPAWGQLIEREARHLRRAALLLSKLRCRCGRKGWMVAACLAVGLIAASLVPVDRSIDSPCAVWPATRAAVIAPDQGAIAAVFVTEGQEVQPGQSLLTLDNSVLAASVETARREVERWRAEAQAREAAGDAPGARSAARDAETADAQLTRLETSLAALTLRAPAAGTIVAPDLRSLLGRAVARGDHIMDVADPGAWLVRIELPQKNIALVERAAAEAADRGGAEVEFALAAQPQKTFRARLVSSTPVARPFQSGAEDAAVVLCATVDPAALAGPDAPTASRAGAEFHAGDQGRATVHLGRQTIARRLLAALCR